MDRPTSSQTKAEMQKLQTKNNMKIGEYSSIHGSASAQSMFSVSESKVKYWLRRFNDPTWHSMPRGGNKSPVFTAEQVKLVVGTLSSLAVSHPLTSYAKLADMVEESTGIRVSKSTVRKVFIQNNWSRGKLTQRQVEKYSTANITYIVEFCKWIATADPTKVKFMNECYFAPKDDPAKRALAPRGKSTRLVHPGSLSNSCCITLATSLTGNRFAWTLRQDSEDFVYFLNCLTSDRFLQRGDVLVTDNARIRPLKEQWSEIREILDANGVSLVQLPLHTPELNPCELVFASVEKFLQAPPDSIDPDYPQIPNDQTFNKLIQTTISRISLIELEDYYRQCKSPKHGTWE